MKPLSRRERIEVLLEHWPDFFEVAARDDGPSGDGGVYLLPGMSRHPSVVELGRALGSLRAFAPGKSAHLFAFYGAPWRTVDRPRRIKGRNGKSGFVVVRVRERVPPSWVRLQKVRDGVALVSQDVSSGVALRRPWCFRGEVFIPAPLLEGLPASGETGVAA